jgi:proteasome-interacting protein CIC1
MARTRSSKTDSPKVSKSVGVKSKKASVLKAEQPASPSVKKTKAKKPVKSDKNVKETEDKVPATQEPKSVVSDKLALKAITELASFLDRESAKKTTDKAQLFDEEDDEEERKVYVQVNNKKYFSEKPEFKPKLIQLSSPIYNQDNLKTCLIIRDQLVSTTEQIEALEQENLPTVSQIIPLKLLKTDYKNFEKRRELYSQYDLFIIDDAVMNLMPTLLGKIFYESGNNKIPLPIRVTNSTDTKKLSIVTLKNQLEKCLKSTYYLPPMGSTITIEIGNISSQYTQEQLVQNLQAVVAGFNASSVKSIMVKTTSSPSLPLFYTKELFDANDVAKEETTTKEEDESVVKFSSFEKSLLQLADKKEVEKVIGKKQNRKHKGKVIKPSKKRL